MKDFDMRIWDKRGKKMLYWGTDFVYITSHKIVLKNDGGMVMPPDVEVLLSTTVKDKNGKRIFEGDILKATYLVHSKAIYYGHAIFDEGSFCLKVNKRQDKKRLYDIGGTPELNNFEYLEVIGNIHENPERLKAISITDFEVNV